MIPFTYRAARSVEEAVAWLAERGTETRLLAGGQSLVPALNHRLARPSVVVDINGLPLNRITTENGSVRIGALVRHHELEASAEIARRCPMVAEAAGLVGNVRVRSLGTLGGSLAHADPAAELPLVACCLDARMTVAGPHGRRVVAADRFFRGPLSTALAPDELLIEATFPVTVGAGTAMLELARRPGDFAIVAAAALVRIDDRGHVAACRLAIGGVGGAPMRVAPGEDALIGHEPTADRLADAGRAAHRAITPEGDAFASAWYRAQLVEVLCRRALARATERAKEAR